jgi:hypothetical protein
MDACAGQFDSALSPEQPDGSVGRPVPGELLDLGSLQPV